MSAKLSKIQRVAALADWRWAREKSPACGRAVFSDCFHCKGTVKCGGEHLANPHLEKNRDVGCRAPSALVIGARNPICYHC